MLPFMYNEQLYLLSNYNIYSITDSNLSTVFNLNNVYIDNNITPVLIGDFLYLMGQDYNDDNDFYQVFKIDLSSATHQ